MYHIHIEDILNIKDDLNRNAQYQYQYQYPKYMYPEDEVSLSTTMEYPREQIYMKFWNSIPIQADQTEPLAAATATHTLSELSLPARIKDNIEDINKLNKILP